MKQNGDESISEIEYNRDFYFFWASARSGFNQLYFYRFRPKSVLSGGVGSSNTDLKNTDLNLNTESGSGSECLFNGQPVSGGGNWVVER